MMNKPSLPGARPSTGLSSAGSNDERYLNDIDQMRRAAREEDDILALELLGKVFGSVFDVIEGNRARAAEMDRELNAMKEEYIRQGYLP